MNFDTANSRVGIGTTVPDSKLHVVGGDVYVAPDSGYTFNNPSANEDLYVYGNLEVDGTIYGTVSGDLTCTNCLDFVDFEDTLDLDANLTLNQAAFTWTQNFDGTTTTGLTYNADSLTSGKALSVVSDNATVSTAFTGDLASISYAPIYTGGVGLNTTGNLLDISRSVTLNNVGNTLTVSGAVATLSDSATQTQGTLTHSADVLQIAQNYTSNTGSALNITSAGGATGFALRVNDDGTFTDTTPFVVTNAGDVGIGTTGPNSKLEVAGNLSLQTNNLLFGTSGSEDTNLYRYAANTLRTDDGMIIGTRNYSGLSAGDLALGGRLNLGNVGVSPGAVLIYGIHSFSGVPAAAGISLTAAFTPTAATDDVTGIFIQPRDSGGSQNLDRVWGVHSTPRLYTGSTATAADARSFYSNPSNVSGSTFTNVYGFYHDESFLAGTIGTQYGLYVENLDNASTNYAIYTAGTTQSYFGGNVGIGDITPDGKLDVEATGAVTASTYGINLSNLVTNTTTDAINKYGAYITSTGGFGGLGGTATNNWGLYVDTVSGADNNYGAYIAGNVGIGDTSPASLLTVGSGDLFQVDSTGSIVSIDGVAHSISDTSGDLEINSIGGDVLVNDRITIGSSTAGVGKLTVTGAEVGKALVILNETGNQNILTASASGTTV
ncbi:MAG: hypothetical protein UX34_C0033G0002, partial [Candidatus Woesebacteria bacterium GW2011_GWF1_46_13]